MLKSFIIAFIFIFSCSNLCHAGDNKYILVSKNPEIIQTLQVLENHNKRTFQTLSIILGDNLTGNPIKISFWNLGELNYNYRKLNALACSDKEGNLHILIDESHRNAPAEALASLLSHEVLHQDAITSLEEEVQAFMAEATTWHSFKNNDKSLCDKSLNSIPLVKRLNTLEQMYIESVDNREQIEKVVYANDFYKNLPEYSPGFGI